MGELLTEQPIIEPPSEADLEKFAPETMDLGLQKVTLDWDAAGFLCELYEQYLSAVQQNRSSSVKIIEFTGGVHGYGRKTTFEEYLRDCLRTLAWRRTELEREHVAGLVDLKVRANGLQIIEMSEEAISKYLEMSDRQRLIGI